MSCPSRLEIDRFQQNLMKPEEIKFIQDHAYGSSECKPCQEELDWVPTHVIPAGFLKYIGDNITKGIWEWKTQGGNKLRAMRLEGSAVVIHIYNP